MPPSSRDRVLSVVSTGTTFGIALTGLAALATIAMGMPWRTGWLAFAAASAAKAAYLSGFPARYFWRSSMNLARGRSNRTPSYSRTAPSTYPTTSDHNLSGRPSSATSAMAHSALSSSESQSSLDLNLAADSR